MSPAAVTKETPEPLAGGMPEPTSQARIVAEDLLFGSCLWVLGRLPVRMAQACGVALGRLAWWTVRRRRRVALENLRLVFGEQLGEAERRRVGRASFESLGRLVADFARMPRMAPADLGRRYVIEGLDHLERARTLDRGVLLLGAHFGSWEMVPRCLALAGHPMAFVGRPGDNPRIEARVRAWRELDGNQLLAKRDAVRSCLAALRRRAIVGILIDQYAPADWGVEGTLLGHEVHTTPIVAALALRTGAPVLPAFAVREGGWRQRIIVGEPVPLDGLRPGAAGVVAATQRFNDILGGYVDAHPDHWLWAHRRFRNADDRRSRRPALPEAARRKVSTSARPVP